MRVPEETILSPRNPAHADDRPRPSGSGTGWRSEAHAGGVRARLHLAERRRRELHRNVVHDPDLSHSLRADPVDSPADGFFLWPRETSASPTVRVPYPASR